MADVFVVGAAGGASCVLGGENGRAELHQSIRGGWNRLRTYVCNGVRPCLPRAGTSVLSCLQTSDHGCAPRGRQGARAQRFVHVRIPGVSDSCFARSASRTSVNRVHVLTRTAPRTGEPSLPTAGSRGSGDGFKEQCLPCYQLKAVRSQNVRKKSHFSESSSPQAGPQRALRRSTCFPARLQGQARLLQGSPRSMSWHPLVGSRRGGGIEKSRPSRHHRSARYSSGRTSSPQRGIGRLE